MRQTNALSCGAWRVSARAALSIALFITCSCGKQAAPPAEEAAANQGTPAAPPLWKPIPWNGSSTPTPQAIKSQTVAINVDQLRPPGNERVSLSLPDGNNITAVNVAFREEDKRFIWRGTIEGDPGSVVTFSAVNGKLVGDIVTSLGRMYRVRFAEKGINIVEQLDPSKFPPEAPPPKGEPPEVSAPGPELSPPPPPTVENPLIDVLVLYTDAAVAFEANNDPDLVTGRIIQAESDTNQSYENSQVKQRIRVVHIERVEGYVEKSNIGDDWTFLMTKNDGQLEQAHTLRAAHAADIVALIVKPKGQFESCGQAGQMHKLQTSECSSAFAVVPINCATGVYSFAHELGHTMGADHSLAPGEGTNNPPFADSHGYEVPTKAWYTIMAKSTVRCTEDDAAECPPRILHWSNPSVPYLGTDTGELNETNNASTLDKTAPYVVNFFPSPECGQANPVPNPPTNIDAN